MNRITVTLFTIMTLVSFLCKGQDVGTLSFQISNLKSSNGAAIINLFRAQDDVPKKPFKTLSSPIKDGTASITFIDIPIGEYAAIAYHDVNENGLLDHKLGFPNEPMGFSNNWHLSLFSGMPTFKKLKFKFDTDHTVIKINID